MHFDENNLLGTKVPSLGRGYNFCPNLEGEKPGEMRSNTVV